MNEKRLLDMAVRLHKIACFGTDDPQGVQRYEEICHISAELLSEIAEIPVDTIKDFLFRRGSFSSLDPDSRAAITKDDRVLLIVDGRGNWLLPEEQE